MAFPANPLYNVSSFDGAIESDYLRYAAIPESEKSKFIDYSLTDFDSYKNALLDYVKAVYPDEFTNFSESDLGVMFVELFAYLGSVISLKADFLANETYLNTVRSTPNLKKLLMLLGVTLKGPTASKAEAVVKITDDFFTEGGVTTALIPRASRLALGAQDKDGKPIMYTLYRANTDGTILFDASGVEDLEFDVVEGTLTYGNFFLMEGELIEQTAIFPSTDDNFNLTLSAGPVVEGSISVSSSDGLLWQETNSLFLASSTQNVFEKKYDDNFNATLTFGNGTKGKRPTPGTSCKIFFRKGGGERGNVARKVVDTQIAITKNTGTIVQAQVFNNTTATGGRNSEDPLHAKKYYPHVFKAQHRCVTGEDYTAEANTFTSTHGVMGKAMAVLRDNGAGANNIDIYCLAKASQLQLERCSLQFKSELLTHLNTKKMMTDEITIVDAVIRTLDLNCTVMIDASDKYQKSAIKQRAVEGLLSYFDVANREFGETLSLSRLQNHMHEVLGVRYFRVDNFPGDIQANINEIIQLNNFELTMDLI
jgi:hypothetical protein